MRHDEQAVVFRSLATLVEAGVPLERALGAVARLGTPHTERALLAVQRRVREGAGLAAALAAEQAAPAAALGIIRAGERGSGLARSLSETAVQLEWEAALAGRVRAALAYPLVLLAVGTGSLVLIVGFILPRFGALLADLGQTLPPATRVLLGVGTLMREYWWLALALIVGGAVGVAAWLDTAAGRCRWHALLLRLPVIGSVRASLATARLGRSLGALLGVGVPVLAALDGAKDAVGDREVARRLLVARTQVAEGRSLSGAFRDAGLGTPLALQLLAVGEGSGRVPELLTRAADAEAGQGARRLDHAVRLLEPALILAFGLVVAFVAAALLQAIYAVRPGGVG